MNEQIPSSMPTENSPIDWPYVCPHCERGFDASMAHQATIKSDTEAELMCSWCQQTDTYEAPDPDEIERPPAFKRPPEIETNDGLTTARLVFKGDAWLQYREAPDGWVYEEMFNADGERIESFTPDFDQDDVDPATAYIQRFKARYERWTVRGLRRQHPHIAAVLLDGH